MFVSKFVSKYTVFNDYFPGNLDKFSNIVYYNKA